MSRKFDLILVYVPFLQMMPFMNEAISILMQKVDRISKTGETIDFHRSLQYTQFK